MRRSMRALCSALGGLCVFSANCGSWSSRVGVSVAAASEPIPNASDCMSFQNEIQEKSIVVHASNVCDRKLSCALRFVVRCEDNEGKPTGVSYVDRKTRQEVQARAKVVVLCASACESARLASEREREDENDRREDLSQRRHDRIMSYAMRVCVHVIPLNAESLSGGFFGSPSRAVPAFAVCLRGGLSRCVDRCRRACFFDCCQRAAGHGRCARVGSRRPMGSRWNSRPRSGL